MSASLPQRLALVALAVATSACQGITLIQLNREFVTLAQQEHEAHRLRESRELDQANYESALEGIQVAFRENGDRAVEAADGADTPQSKVSFLNVAARSYLMSGNAGDTEIPDIAQQGRDECEGQALQGLNALPVTCGYFHLVVPQAILNEAQRAVGMLKKRAAVAQNASPRGYLPAEDGRRLEAALNSSLAQVQAIDGAETEIDWTNADPDFRQAFDRQKTIAFCNAYFAWALLDDIQAVGPDWNRDATKAATDAQLDAAQTQLGIVSRAGACPP